MRNGEFQETYPWDREFKEPYVICGVCALARNGLVYANAEHLELFTEYRELDRLNTLAFAYFYNPGIDYEYELSRSVSNPLLLLPSKERALAECIRFADNVDEGFLIEGLKSYLDNFWDDRLYDVAGYFGVTREKLDYWLREAREDCEV